MKIKTLFLFVVAIVLLSITVYAHKGNVDDDGGHYNRSTGEYHFHHRQPPHQHPNNTCEYNFEWGPDTSTGSSSSSSPSSSSSSTPKYTANDIELFTDTSEVDLEPPQEEHNILVTIFLFLCLYVLIFLLPCMFGLFIVVTIIDKIFKAKISDCFNYKPLWVFAFIFFIPFLLSKIFDFKYEKHLIVIDIVLFIGMIIYYRIKNNKFYEAEEDTTPFFALPAPVNKAVETEAQPMQYNGKPVKARHCKHCGGLLPQDSGTCFDCGKKNFRVIPSKLTTSSVLAVVLAIGLTLVCVASYHQSVEIAELSAVIAKKNNLIERNESTILRLNADLLISKNEKTILANQLSDARISTSKYDGSSLVILKEDVKQLKLKLSNSEKQLDYVRGERENFRVKSDFLDDNVAFVPVNGKNYHTYDCAYITNGSFWVDSIYDAKNMGYTPCATCH